MKVDELTKLTKIIQVIVRQELKKELPKAIAKIFQNISGDNHSEIHALNPDYRINVKPSHVEVEETPMKSYAKDNRLNEALNATTMLHSQRQMVDYSSPRVSLTDMFEKNGVEEVFTGGRVQESPIDTSTKLGMLRSIVSKEPIGQQVSVLDNIHSSPIAHVFKKDFRALMKKIDEKQKKGAGGGSFSRTMSMNSSVGDYSTH